MNKVEKLKILNYCIQNAENLFFSHIKEIELIKKIKKLDTWIIMKSLT